MKSKGRLIALKILTDRVKNQLGLANFIMLVYVFAISSPYPIWLILPVMTGMALILGYFDYRFVLPKEYEKITLLNPVMLKIKNDVDEIKEMIKDGMLRFN